MERPLGGAVKVSGTSRWITYNIHSAMKGNKSNHFGAIDTDNVLLMTIPAQ